MTLTGPGAPQQLTSDADGTFGLGALPPGTYTLTVVPPTGTRVVGSATRTVVITAAGDVIAEQDFTLAADAVVVPPDPTDPSTPPTDGGNGTDPLPATGLGPETLAWAAGGAAVLVLGATLLILGRRRSAPEVVRAEIRTRVAQSPGNRATAGKDCDRGQLPFAGPKSSSPCSARSLYASAKVSGSFSPGLP